MAIDVDFDKRVLLLHFDGTHGSTTFTDSSPYAHTCTAVGNAQITTAQSVFGGASVTLDGTGDSVDVTYSSALNLAGADWVVEGRSRLLASSGTQIMVDFRGTGGQTVSFVIFAQPATTQLRVYDGTTNTFPVSTSTGTLPLNTWFSWAATVVGTTLRLFIDGVLLATGTMTTPATHSSGVRIGYDGASGWEGQHDEIRISKAFTGYTATYTPDASAFSDERGGWVQADGPLGQPALFGLLDVQGPILADGPLAQPALLGWSLYGLIADAGPLGQPSIFGRLVFGYVAAPSVLAAPALFGAHDFTAQLDLTARTTYVMALVTPGGLVRVPISSWQSTLNASEASYLQCVIPAVTEWVSTLESATSFIIYRRTTLLTGGAYEYAMATAPTQTISLDQSGRRHTATISGYTDTYPTTEPTPSRDRALEGVRLSSSTGGRRRVQCAIDWLLQPGQRAVLDGDPFEVAYISYFCNTTSESMIVGEAEV